MYFLHSDSNKRKKLLNIFVSLQMISFSWIKYSTYCANVKYGELYLKLAAGFLRPTAPKGQTSVSSGMFIFSSLLTFLGLEDKETSEGAAEEHQQHVYGKKTSVKSTRSTWPAYPHSTNSDVKVVWMKLKGQTRCNQRVQLKAKVIKSFRFPVKS